MTLAGIPGGALLVPPSGGSGPGPSPPDGVANSLAFTLDDDAVLHGRIGRSVGAALTATVALGVLDDYRGDWAAGIYGVGNVTRHASRFYICKTARTASNTDSPDHDTAGWQLLGDGTGSGGGGEITGATLTTDSNDNLILAIEQTEGTSPITAQIHLTSVSSYKGAWSDTRVYAIGEMVSYSGRFYLRKTNGSAAGDASATPDTDTDNWQLVGAGGGSGSGGPHLQTQHLTFDPDTHVLTLQSTLSDSTDVSATVDLSGLADVGTDLSLGNRTTSGVTIQSSTGTNVVIPPASGTEPGVFLAAEHTLLAGQLALWAPGQYDAGANAIYGRAVYVRRTAGTDNAAQTPPNNNAWLALNELGGLTQSQVDARIRALVNALALIGDSDIWGKARLPSDIVYSADLAHALSPYLTATQIQAAITQALTGYMEPKGDWSTSIAYAPGDVVKHTGATYLCLQNVSSGGQEPGAGSNWEAFWDRLGYEDGPPNAFVGAAIDGADITFTREGGENPVTLSVPALFKAIDIGEATFDLSINTNPRAIELDDSDGNHLVAPETGFVVITMTAPTLGARGRVYWMLAEDLRAARGAAPLTGGFYTVATSGAMRLQVPAQTANSSGNKVLVQHIGVTKDETDGGSVTPNPSILHFTVTGNQNPAPGSIAGDKYSYDDAIAQGGNVSAARIIGFAGAPVKTRPSAFATLATLTSPYATGSGEVAIPAGTTLASAGDQYTIRLEVFGEGQATTDQPVGYHDYTITARTAAAEVHFGFVGFPGGTVADVDFSSTDISTAGAAAGTWTISGLPNDNTTHALYWAVPTSRTQPQHWTVAGFNIDNSINAPVARTINSVEYQIYLGNAGYVGSRTNGSTIVVS